MACGFPAVRLHALIGRGQGSAGEAMDDGWCMRSNDRDMVNATDQDPWRLVHGVCFLDPKGRKEIAGGASPRKACPIPQSPEGAKGTHGLGWAFGRSFRPFGAPILSPTGSGGLRPRLSPFAPFGARKGGRLRRHFPPTLDSSFPCNIAAPSDSSGSCRRQLHAGLRSIRGQPSIQA